MTRTKIVFYNEDFDIIFENNSLVKLFRNGNRETVATLENKHDTLDVCHECGQETLITNFACEVCYNPECKWADLFFHGPVGEYRS